MSSVTNQVNIFDELNMEDERKCSDYLFILKDNRQVLLGLEDVFDYKKYDEIYAITYVSSPPFFSKYTKNFGKITFILGIDDSENLEKFTRGIPLKNFLDVDYRIEFWNNLDEDIKIKINQRKLDIRFGNTDVIIHDKIYLLKNSLNNETRVITGSANFTQNAFANNKQFENIRIDDNNEELFNIYFKRFKEIYDNTFDFIPDRLKVQTKTEKVVFVKDGELSKNILFDEIVKNNRKLVIEENHLEEIKELVSETEYIKDSYNQTEEILNLITQKKNGHIEIKTQSQLEKKTIAIKTVFCKINNKSYEADQRPCFIYNSISNSIMKGSDGTDHLDDKYSCKISSEKIKQGLLKINDFIEAYRLFALNPCVENQSKVFEIILYGFTSPYIWKIRNAHVLEQGIESVRADFPPFMIIGGVAKSGKTTALEFLSLLLGNNGKRYFKYAQDVSKAGILFDYFNTENLFPIMVDEIEQNFFYKNISNTKGEGFIKHVSNNLNSKHPVMIGTTNSREFSSSGQILRRIYYIEINNVFDENKKAESMNHLSNILSDTDDTLFRDFSYRISSSINNKEQFYATDDVLYKAREIFKDYYNEAGLEIPTWLPEKQFNDYADRKINVWSNLFDAQRQYFKENDKGTIYVYIDEILKNAKTKKEKDSLINFLDETCIIENNVVLELNKKKFYDFIGYKKNITPLHKILKKLKIKSA